MNRPDKNHVTRTEFSATATDPSGTTEQLAEWPTLPGGVVDGGEIVLLATKPSLFRPFAESAGWIGLSVIASLFVIRLGYGLPGWSVAATVQLLLVIGFGRLAWALVRWVTRWYILTNRRIVDIEGVREPRIWSCSLLDVRNTYLNRSLLERLSQSGTITIVTEDERIPPRYWASVPKSEQVHQAIRRAIEHAIDRHAGA